MIQEPEAREICYSHRSSWSRSCQRYKGSLGLFVIRLRSSQLMSEDRVGSVVGLHAVRFDTANQQRRVGRWKASCAKIGAMRPQS